MARSALPDWLSALRGSAWLARWLAGTAQKLHASWLRLDSLLLPNCPKEILYLNRVARKKMFTVSFVRNHGSSVCKTEFCGRMSPHLYKMSFFFPVLMKSFLITEHKGYFRVNGLELFLSLPSSGIAPIQKFRVMFTVNIF